MLIYLSMAEHKAEIVADEAIHAKVAPEIWGEAMAKLVAEVRHGRIADGMIDPIYTDLILANAIYFKAAWDVAFNEATTKPELFFGPAGSVTTPMMHSTASRGRPRRSAAHDLRISSRWRHGAEVGFACRALLAQRDSAGDVLATR